MRMEDDSFDHLSDEQRKALDRLLPLLDPDGVDKLASQGPDAVKARLRVFSEYENALSEHIHARMPSPVPPMAPAAAQDVVFIDLDHFWSTCKRLRVKRVITSCCGSERSKWPWIRPCSKVSISASR